MHGGEVNAQPDDAEMRQEAVKIAWYDCLLLSSFFSPGTPFTVTVIVTGRPVGGRLGSGTDAVAVAPCAIRSIDWSTVIGLLPAPEIFTETVTFFSSFWPWFWTWTSNDRPFCALMSVVPAVDSAAPDGCTVTATRPVPWRPGVAVDPSSVEAVPVSCEATDAGRSQSMVGRKP